MVEKLYPTLKKLDLSDISKGDGEIDLLIGADYYWTVVERGIQKCGPNGLTAINSKLGWVLNGPYENKGADKRTDEVLPVITAANLVDVMDDVSVQMEHDGSCKDVETLWDLETLGIRNKEVSWIEKCLDNFDN